ncbi:MAG: WXG100 family type VII secretion target, partial [Acidimicrobiaceae bacterium]|nr:WXG100 family type VII secretion target [Acidimicrobiaceae bacterium]
VGLRTTPGTPTGSTSSFSVDHSALTSASQHVNDVADSISQELVLLLNALSGLEGQWQGQAAVTFDSVKQRWAQDQSDLAGGLHAIGDMLARSGLVYMGSDDEGQSGLAQIQSVLGR